MPPTFEQQIDAVGKVGFPIVVALIVLGALIGLLWSVAKSARDNGNKIDEARKESDKRYEALNLLITNNQKELLLLIGERSDRSYYEMKRAADSNEKLVQLLAPVAHRYTKQSRSTDTALSETKEA